MAQGLDERAAAAFARLALECVHKEYPNKIAHVLNGDDDVKPPRELTPVFYGCYDWHSAVHGHWLLARLARLFPSAAFAGPARAALAESLTSTNIAGEVRYLEGDGRASFERPYGLAWLLQLAAELREWGGDDEVAAWSQALEPLERLAARRISEWLPKLTHPIRIGEHAQTAFAFGLILDWARQARDGGMDTLMRARVKDYYAGDDRCPMDYEPSGQDFLSPCLAEADLMRRVMGPAEFADWLGRFLPEIPTSGVPSGATPRATPGPGATPNVRAGTAGRWLEPAAVTDPADGKLAHLDGLNLSRAWMLEGMAAGLPPTDARLVALGDAARRHREAGLLAVTGEHYEGGHWLGSFATYLVTERGLR